jgi:hypothetical protein
MIEINLIQKRKKIKLPTVMGVDLAKLNIKAIVFALILSYGATEYVEEEWKVEIQAVRSIVKAKERKLKKLSIELKKNANVKDKLVKFKNQETYLKSRSKQVEKIISKRVNPYKLLERIARNVPEDMWFELLGISEQSKLRIKGKSFSYTSIGNFITSSNESLYFGKSLALAKSETKEETHDGQKVRVEEFEMTGDIKVFDPSVR